MATGPQAAILPPHEADHAASVRHIVRLGLLVLLLGVVGVGLWMALAPLSGAVVAPGTVTVDMNRKTVQHQEGGIVREILVRNGDRVRAGQTLIVLDDVRVDAALDLLRNQLDSERARNARLSAERALAAKVVLPKELSARSAEPKIREIIGREQTLFDTRRQALESQVALLQTQIRQTNEEAQAWHGQIEAEARALKLQKDELAANEDLLKKNFVQKTRVLTLQRAVAEYEARLGEHRAEFARAQQKATDLELRIIGLKNSYVQAAADDLKESTNRIFELEERLRPSSDAAQRQNIVAPVAGEVVDLRVTSVGAVIGPREPLLDIVPADVRLIVEARIRTEDVNHVQVGSPVDLRLTAFKLRTTPLVEGTVTYVSADRLVDRTTNAPYYQVHIEVSPESLRAAGDLKLQAGMPAEVFIKTAERTVFQYLLDPVTAYVRRGFREP